MPEQKLKEEEKENKQLRGHRGEGNKISTTSLKYNFSDAIQGNTGLAVPVEDSICTMQVLDALAEAAKTGCTITPSYS